MSPLSRMARHPSPSRAALYAPLLLAVPVAQVLSANVERSPASEALSTYGLTATAFAATAVALRRAFRRPEITDLALALLFAALFLPITFLPSTAYRLPWAGGFAGAIILVFVWEESRRLFPVILGALSLVLVVSAGVATWRSPVWATRGNTLGVVAQAFPDPDPVATPKSQPPDIFYLVFDRYWRADFLKSEYGFDNQPFLNALRERGFYVADAAYANYQRTAHSLVSTLNLDYLDALQTEKTAGVSDWLPLFGMFQDFRVGRVLKSAGYEIHFAGTWWGPTRRIASADVHHNHYEAPELPRVIYEHSLLVSAARAFGWRPMDPLYWQCRRSQLMFDDLQSLPHRSRPRFYFAHFLVPHPPFVTHESGRCMSIREAQGRSRSTNYVGQVRYTNAQLLATVDRLLAGPGPKPIIVIQADEGPWPERFAGEETALLGRDVSNVDWRGVSDADLRAKMAILSAIYAPEIPASDMHPGQTPVNTFRKILRSYFGATVPLLPDRSKIYLSADDIYTFQDVTDRLIAAR